MISMVSRVGWPAVLGGLFSLGCERPEPNTPIAPAQDTASHPGPAQARGPEAQSQGYGGLPEGAPWVDFGLRALDLSSARLSGEPIWLSDFLGAGAPVPKKIVVLAFFATWCEPCFAHELPALARWQERYGAKGLQILAVNVRGFEQPIDEAIAETLHQLEPSPPLPFPLLFDRTLRNQRVYLGEVAALPTSFLIDTEGTVLRRIGGADEARLASLECRVAHQLGATGPEACGAVHAPGKPL